MALNVSERLALKNSLRKIKLDENQPGVSFWGKITGNRADYLIAKSQVVTDKIAKSYYFSVDNGLTFAKLPDLDDWILEKAPKIRGPFTGNPAYNYKDPDAPKKNPDEEEEEEEEEDEVDEAKQKDPPPRKLFELERVSHAVNSIEADTCVVPAGAYYMTPTGDVSVDRSFKGLSSQDVQNISSYLLLRDPRNSSTLARIRKQGVSNITSFLDAITENQPAGLWSVQTDESGENVSVRSLVWPGYEFKTEVNSPDFVGAYFGSGERNDDVLFML